MSELPIPNGENPREHSCHGTPESEGVLYDGDPGELPYLTRRVLAKLLSGPSIEAKLHSELWPALCRDEKVIRKRLGDLFLSLVMDKERGIAFVRQSVREELDIPILLRSAPLTFIDSALVLFLRERLILADNHAERAVVSEEDIREHLGLYERASNTDRAGFERRVIASIKKMKEYDILRNLDASGERREISQALRLMFTADHVSALLKTYRDLAESERVATFSENDDDASAEETEE